MEWYKFSEKTPDRFDTILISDGKDVLAAGFGSWNNKKANDFLHTLNPPDFVEAGWSVWFSTEKDVTTETFPYWAKWPEPPTENDKTDNAEYWQKACYEERVKNARLRSAIISASDLIIGENAAHQALEVLKFAIEK